MTKLHQRNVPVGDTSTMASRIRRSQESLSPAELKLSRALANYPAAGLESTNALAKKVGISAPTVLRFITRIGFGRYPRFPGRFARGGTGQARLAIDPARSHFR